MNELDLLADTMSSLAILQNELYEAVTIADSSQVDRLLARIGLLERRRNRLVHQLVGMRGQKLDASTPLRDQIVTVLRLLARPSSIRLVADVARARFGEAIPTGRIASLRRDEERSWSRAPGARPDYIVPALSSDRFAPMRAEVALASWPLEIRIVGPASPRVDMLKVLCRLADESGRHLDSQWTRGLEPVIWRLAATVPNAIEPEGALDLSVIRLAATYELQQLEQDDARERQDAADRAKTYLDDQAQLFGARFRVVRGGLVSAGGSS